MTISILGCGWLGLPLAEDLRDAGHFVKGSTTTAEKLELLKGKKITPFLLKLNPALECENCEEFWNSELLILNIPPGRKQKNVESFHERQISAVIEKLNNSPVEFVIFVSSTSVYPEKAGLVDEDDTEEGKAARPSGNALLKAEKMLMKQTHFQTTVLRFGGLYGRDRHPAKYLAGRKDLEKGSAPVNLIHQDDCIGIIREVIDKNIRGEIFNGVSDGHPPREMYYTAAAKSLGLEPPVFKEDKAKNYKIVSNRKLKRLLKYKFQHPNPMIQ